VEREKSIPDTDCLAIAPDCNQLWVRSQTTRSSWYLVMKCGALDVCECAWAIRGNTCKHVLKALDFCKQYVSMSSYQAPEVTGGNTYGETSRVNEDMFRHGPSSSYPTSEVEGGNTYGEISRVNEDTFRHGPSSLYPTSEVEGGNTYGETSRVNEDTFRHGPSSSYPTSEVEGGSNAAETSPRRRLSFNNLASAQ
ncbi:hypothetical protein KI387_030835, partial [Taxus chinensis]